jgi:hypothetical protein
MCGRYRLSRRKQMIEEYFATVSGEDDWIPRYNIAPTQPVPDNSRRGSFGFCRMTDDEDLHTRWAALLANAATSPKLVHPSYVEILKQLTPEDAQLLDKLFDSCKDKRYRRVTPWIGVITYDEREAREAAGEHPEVSFRNLVRLGLIEVIYELDDRKVKVRVARSSGMANVKAELDDHYVFTDVAMAFVQACRAPKTIDAQQSDFNRPKL